MASLSPVIDTTSSVPQAERQVVGDALLGVEEAERIGVVGVVAGADSEMPEDDIVRLHDEPIPLKRHAPVRRGAAVDRQAWLGDRERRLQIDCAGDPKFDRARSRLGRGREKASRT
jgi:hypothetical protein